MTAAVLHIDSRGLPELTMRKLGGALGVDAMSLYGYVSGREDLLDGVVEMVLDEVDADPHVFAVPRHGWADYLRRLAHGFRRMALAHPAVFPLLVTRPPVAPWIRPPLRSLRGIESFLSALVTEGFNHPEAVMAYRAFSGFLLGHLLLDVAQRAKEPADPAGPAAGLRVRRAELGDHTHVGDLEPLLSAHESVSEFDYALAGLIERLGAARGGTT